MKGPGGGIGRRASLRGWSTSVGAGSTPVPGNSFGPEESFSLLFTAFFLDLTKRTAILKLAFSFFQTPAFPPLPPQSRGFLLNHLRKNGPPFFLDLTRRNSYNKNGFCIFLPPKKPHFSQPYGWEVGFLCQMSIHPRCDLAAIFPLLPARTHPQPVCAFSRLIVKAFFSLIECLLYVSGSWSSSLLLKATSSFLILNRLFLRTSSRMS